MYITATSPYLFMLALLIRNCLLPGARGGIEFYLTPQWERLADLEVNFQDIFPTDNNNLRCVSSLLGNVRDCYVAIFVHGCLAYPKFRSSGCPGWGHILFETRSFETGRHGGRASCLDNCGSKLLLNSNTQDDVLMPSLIILLLSFEYMFLTVATSLDA